MTELGWQAWLTLVTLVGVIYLLFSGRLSSDAATLGGLGVLLVAGAVDLETGLQGFSNRGVLTIGALFIVAALLRRSGGLDLLTAQLFANTKSLRLGLLRMMIPTAIVSGFFNNTPVVALLIPGAKAWAEEHDFPASKVLIPLSYAAILGGTCTIIGTSTNLVVNGFLIESGETPLSFFAIGAIGLPIALAGIVFLTLLAPRLLPDRTADGRAFVNPATFTTEAIVVDDGDLPGTALGDANIGELNGLYPVEIRRGDVLIPAPQPDLVLQGGDRLVLAGAAAHFVRVHRSEDLTTTTDHQFELPPALESQRRVVEAVLSDHCPLVGAMVGDGTFRSHYGAAVIAMSRAGDRVPTDDLGDWRLRVGDRLLLEAGDGFESHRNSRDFFVVNEMGGFDEQGADWRAFASILVVIAMVTVAAFQWVPLLEASISAIVALFLLKPSSGGDLRDEIDWQVVLTIAAAFGIAGAAQQTGVASFFAASVIGLGAGSPLLALVAVYLATFVMTELITNNAAAALSFPLALAVAQELGVSVTPFAVAVMIAASASFMTPLGYQTNLMVYGAGDYRVSDFVKIGWPMAIISAVFTIALVPIFFPF